jgi:outer membrane protein OmpA-like peptidoglycan-associated protein
MAFPTRVRLPGAVPFTLVALTIAACAGCASAPRLPPHELSDAREELGRARQSPAGQLDPTDIHEADLALGRAEHAWQNDPDAPSTVDLAVTAQRRAQIAEAEAAAIQAHNRFEADKVARQAATEDALRAAQGKLGATERQLDDTQSAMQHQQQMMADMALKLKDARDTIAKIASVKDDDRGMVITLESEVLFKTGKSDLKPAAMAKLDQIASALTGKEQPIRVLGYTDNVGALPMNMELSQRRAASVRDYLVSKGLPQDLVTAEGKGPDSPVADNSSVEGRATNRRVELVVAPRK